MEIIVTLREILDSGYWDEFCDEKGWNPYCINEGVADASEEVRLTEEQAKRWRLL